MGNTYEGHLTGAGLHFGIVISRFNDALGKELLSGAQDALRRHGVAPEDVDVAWVPGAFEIPLGAQHMAASGRYQALICLGVIIRGETPHFDFVASQAAGGISAAAQRTGVPITFGVLTTATVEQAQARAGLKAGNKGMEAATAAIEMANLLRALEAA